MRAEARGGASKGGMGEARDLRGPGDEDAPEPGHEDVESHSARQPGAVRRRHDSRDAERGLEGNQTLGVPPAGTRKTSPPPRNPRTLGDTDRRGCHVLVDGHHPPPDHR